MNLTKFVTAGLCILFLGQLAQAAPPPTASLDTFSLGYRGEYFFSTNNLGATSGDTDPLPQDGEYSNFSNHFEAAYTLSPGLRFSLGGTWAYAESTSFFQPRDNSAFNRGTISAQYYRNFGRLLLIPMVLIHIATEEIDPNQNEVFTSEGSNQYQGGAWMKYPLWKFDSWIYLGYRAQDDDKADHFLWSIGTKFYPSDWFISGELNGYSVARNDFNTRTGFPGNRSLINQSVAGGSLKYNSADPEYIDGEIIAGFRNKGGYEFSAGLNHTVTGTNTGYGPTIVFGFTMDFRSDSKPLDSAHRVSETGSFRPDFETYDESTFKDE